MPIQSLRPFQSPPRFSGGVRTDFDLRKVVRPIGTAKLSQEFVTAVENATGDALMSLPAGLRREILDGGFTLTPLYSNNDIRETWRVVYSALDPRFEVLKAAIKMRGLSSESQKAVLAQYDETHPARRVFRDTLSDKERDWAILSHIQTAEAEYHRLQPTYTTEAFDKMGPHYCQKTKTAMIPEFVNDIDFTRLRRNFELRDYMRGASTWDLMAEPPDAPRHGWWKTLTMAPEKLTRAIRHEIWHHIDFDLGTKKTGGYFSRLPIFHQALKEDIQTVPRSNRPLPWEYSELAGRMDYYLPMLKEPKSTECSEPFAEAGAALTGGGACNPLQIRSICPKAIEAVRHLVLGEPKPMLSNGIQRWFRSITAHWK